MRSGCWRCFIAGATRLSRPAAPSAGSRWPSRPAATASGLRSRGVEAYVIHAEGIAVSREHRRAKTDRLDTETLMRAFLGWLRGEARHCSMAAIPTLAEEDAKRPTREHDNLVAERTRGTPKKKKFLWPPPPPPRAHPRRPNTCVARF